MANIYIYYLYSEIAEEKHKYVPHKCSVHPKLNYSTSPHLDSQAA